MSEVNVPASAVEQVLETASEKVVEKTASTMPTEATKPDQTDEFSSRFAALNRRERDFIQREQALKKQVQELQSKATFKDEFEAKKALAKTDPKAMDAILDEMGLTFDEYLNLKIQNGEKEQKPKTVEEMYQELQDRLNKKDAEELKNAQNLEEQRAEETLNNFRNAISEHVESSADMYTSIHSLGEQETVFKVVEAHLEDTGEVMSIDEACKLVESYFEEKLDGLLQTKKFKAKYFAEKRQEAAKVEETEPQLEVKAPAKQVNFMPKTITNSMQSQGLSSKIDLSNEMERSKKEAAKLIRWN